MRGQAAEGESAKAITAPPRPAPRRTPGAWPVGKPEITDRGHQQQKAANGVVAPGICQAFGEAAPKPRSPPFLRRRGSNRIASRPPRTAREGPAIRAPLKIVEFRAMALPGSSFPTMATRKACRPGKSKALTTPSKPAWAKIGQSVIVPASASPAKGGGLDQGHRRGGDHPATRWIRLIARPATLGPASASRTRSGKPVDRKKTGGNCRASDRERPCR